MIDDTIYALASAKGRAGVAVVRISGSKSEIAAARFCGSVPQDRGLRVLVFEDEVLDEALVLRFPKGRSFTGELVVELHLHGSPAIVSAVLQALGTMEGVRPAEAGEFTRRALENGKLDLPQVEGLADLIDAETEAQRRQAMRVFQGALGEIADEWRKDLIRAAALVEATIDFVDEDVPVDVFPEVLELLGSVKSGLIGQIDGYSAAERVRDGFEVAIIGPPNVGKSTLLNALAGREAAITSSVAGTTRDVIEVRMEIGGYPVTLLDTAGLRETSDPVEKLGVALARKRSDAADLRIHILDPESSVSVFESDGDIVVFGKADKFDGPGHRVSGLSGAGLDELIQRVKSFLYGRNVGSPLAIRERHRIAMRDAVDHIDMAMDPIQLACHDIAAEEIRSAVASIDLIVGRIDVEDLLGEIFASFCIGK